MPRASVDRFRVTVTGQDKAARDLTRAERRLQDELVRTVRELAAFAHTAVLEEARWLSDTGDMERSLHVRQSFAVAAPRFTVEMGAAGHGGDPRPYIDVLRFGHRADVIHPTRGRALKVHYAGHRSPHLFVFRDFVGGVGHGGRDSYDPHDFIDGAIRRVDAEVHEAARRLGRRIERTTL